MPEQQYLDLLRDIMTNGEDGPGRDSPTRAVFGRQMKFDLADGFPLLTTKKVHFRSIVYELLWMIAGQTNVKWLQQHGVTIWDEWAAEDGGLGPVYGKQWRSWDRTLPDGQKAPIDQLMGVIDLLRRDPHTRRAMVSAWNPADLPDMALPPCHALFQFRILSGRLHCHLYQRSADCFLGLPFNIASYSLLTMLVAETLDLSPGVFTHSLGDAHIYHNHFDQVATQLAREPTAMPRVIVKARDHLPSYKFEDIALCGYKAWPPIPADVSK